jgi:hypothetical protein
MTEPSSGHPTATSGLHTNLASFNRRLGECGVWLRQTFAGLTWSRFGIFCLVIVGMALTKPQARMALLGDGDFASRAAGLAIPLALVFVKFTPTLFVVVAAANRGPHTGWPQIRWLAAAVVIGQTVGVCLSVWVLPMIAPNGYLARLIGLHESAAMQAVRWIGVTLAELGIAVTAVAFWYYFKRNADAGAALHEAQQESEDVRREGTEARLLVMQAQIEPHFLFNTLASIRRLYETDPASGRSMLRHLSSYLTASLPTLRAAQSTLGRELTLATAYLNVQKIRMGNRLAVHLDVPSSLHAIAIPPMMLATLVENAVVHGIGPLPEGGSISIAARADGKRLAIEVSDTGRGLRDVWGAGVGLANIRARLHSEFGDAASVQLANGARRGATATLEMPLPATANALAA